MRVLNHYLANRPNKHHTKPSMRYTFSLSFLFLFFLQALRLQASRYLSHEFIFVVGLFLQCWAGLPPAVLGPSVLSKEVETSPTATHFGLACAQTMPR